ncbi:MAG TPA: YigZ family protein [Mucilaginibacter sp.]|nr:YigZ family protein [Mucilaginibacter sp.]
MLFDDTYRTIGQPSEGSFRDRGSKFISFAYPINSEQEIRDIVAKLKREHPKANHHCWALRWSTDRSVFRLNDDGEPSGTAGRPILNTLLSRDLTNIAVVVVRYFGGTLLGVPGLINAYKTAAEQALDNAPVVEKTVNDVYEITFGYAQMNDVMRAIKDNDLQVLGQHFDNICTMKVSIRKTHVEQALAHLQKIPLAELKYVYTI